MLLALNRNYNKGNEVARVTYCTCNKNLQSNVVKLGKKIIICVHCTQKQTLKSPSSSYNIDSYHLRNDSSCKIWPFLIQTFPKWLWVGMSGGFPQII